MSFRHTLTHVLGKSRAQRSLELATLELRTQFIHRCDPEFLIRAENALRVETGDNDSDRLVPAMPLTAGFEPFEGSGRTISCTAWLMASPIPTYTVRSES